MKTRSKNIASNTKEIMKILENCKPHQKKKLQLEKKKVLHEKKKMKKLLLGLHHVPSLLPCCSTEDYGLINALHMKAKEGLHLYVPEVHGEIIKKIQYYMKLPHLSAKEVDIIRQILIRESLYEKLLVDDNNKVREESQISYIDFANATHINKLDKNQDGFNEIGNDGTLHTETISNNDVVQDIQGRNSSNQELEGRPYTPKCRRPYTPKCRTINLESKRSSIPFKIEMKSLSEAVHRWMKSLPNGIMFLKEKRLKTKHFRKILRYAGPRSRLRLLNARSPLEIKNLWRNAANYEGEHFGHKLTGFESQDLLHSPESQYCPFNHCSEFPVCDNGGLNRLSDDESCRSLNLDDSCAIPLSPDESESGRNSTYRSVDGCKRRLNFPDQKVMNTRITKYATKNSKLIKCKVSTCLAEFTTTFALRKHEKNFHADDELNREKEACKICQKLVYNLCKHYKNVHPELLDRTCQVCNRYIDINDNMKEHRGLCNKCPNPNCDFVDKNLTRLVNHIKKCGGEKGIISTSNSQTSRLMISEQSTISEKDSMGSHLLSCENSKRLTPDINSSAINIIGPSHGRNVKESDLTCPGSSSSEIEVRQCVSYSQTNNVEIGDELSRPRRMFGFDKPEDQELYESEWEDADSPEVTKKRRESKDLLELALRACDDEETNCYRGVERIVNDFYEFLRTDHGCMRKPSNDVYDRKMEPSTYKLYRNYVKKDLLPLFSVCYTPFKFEWLFDCESVKPCRFLGQERNPEYVNLKDPICLTIKIFKKAIEKFNGEDKGVQRAQFAGAVKKWMLYVENYFLESDGAVGFRPFDFVKRHHDIVRSFMESLWKGCNKDKKTFTKQNKTIKDILNPDYDEKILRRHMEYLQSERRESDINFVLTLGRSDIRPTRKDYIRAQNIVLSELHVHTGRRPVVFERLKNGAFHMMKPGFNPYDVSHGDSVVEADEIEGKIHRRVNPNFAPSHKACCHQRELETAICPESCPDSCDPDGYNLWCDWDKNRNSSVGSYIHIPRQIKVLIDHFNLVKSRFFATFKPNSTWDDDWINNENTTMFLNSKGLPIASVDMTHVSEFMGIDVTAYAYRRIITTWGRSNPDKQIRESEPEVLQHSSKMADEIYLQNKQHTAQQFVQAYQKEDGLLTSGIAEKIEQSNNLMKATMVENDMKMAKKYKDGMLGKEMLRKEQLKQNKPLGPSKRIYQEDRTEFVKLIFTITGRKIDKEAKDMRFSKLRKFLTRTICLADGETGRRIQELWVSFYRGDGQYGVRNMRWDFLKSSCPMNAAFLLKRDRNTWISWSLHRSLKVKGNAKKLANKVI